MERRLLKFFFVGYTQYIEICPFDFATGGIVRAFSDAGWNVEQRLFRSSAQIDSSDIEPSRQGLVSLVVVRGRFQVRQLVRTRLLQHIDLLVADNITRQEQEFLGEEFQCQVIAKPYQNDDLIEALGSVSQGSMKKAA